MASSTFTQLVLHPQKTLRLIRDGEPRMASSTFHTACVTSTETLRLIRDGEPRMASSTFTQLVLHPQKP